MLILILGLTHLIGAGAGFSEKHGQTGSKLCYQLIVLLLLIVGVTIILIVLVLDGFTQHLIAGQPMNPIPVIVAN